jgi:hypothetical protein
MRHLRDQRIIDSADDVALIGARHANTTPAERNAHLEADCAKSDQTYAWRQEFQIEQ